MGNKTSSNGSASSTPTLPTNEAALESVRAELLAIAEEAIDREPRVNPVTFAATVEAAAAKVVRHRAEAVALCGEQAGTRIDRLAVYARAAAQAAIEAKASVTSGDLSSIHEEVRAKHALVMAELDSCVMRGHLDGALLSPARPVQGYEETIQSAKVAVFVARQNWAAIADKTHLTPAILDATVLAAERLERAIIDRDHGVSRAPAVELRTRAVSKLLAEYDEVRRIVTYVRWHQGDYDTLAPSPYAGRGRRGTNAGGEEDLVDEEEVVTPVTPSPVNGGGPFTS